MNKKIAYLVAFRDFKDEEYFTPVKILKEAGIKVETYSDKKGLAVGESGGEVMVKNIDELNVSQKDALVLAGGPGALKHLNNERVHGLLQKAEKEKKIIAAICISPLILAESGVLKDKKATVWTSDLNKKPKKQLEKRGAEFISKPVVKDERIVTANGPQAAKQFGKKILDSLN